MDPAGIDRPRAREVREAQHALEEARVHLDSAVGRIPEVDGDKTMATPELLMLLVGAVKAKERLDALEAVLTTGDRK